MRPALEPGDWVVAQRRRGVPGRGSVVVFTIPDQSGVFLIKRVVGLPGERVTVADGQVHIDGQTLAEPWVSGLTVPDGEDTVPEDAVWVLGDNRALSSADSRTIGPVALDDIGWTALAIYWPSARVSMI